MVHNSTLTLLASLLCLTCLCTEARASQPLPLLQLPAHSVHGSRPLMKVLADRQSVRAYANRPVSTRLLGNVLWAACGINRPATGKRTAPSARNQQAIDVYVAMKDGVFLYLPKAHALQLIVKGDHRETTTTGQDYVKNAALNLIYVADRRKMKVDSARQEFYAATDTGFIAQNVYLYATSCGLSSVVRGSVDGKRLHELLRLAPEQFVTLCHSVGHGAEEQSDSK